MRDNDQTNKNTRHPYQQNDWVQSVRRYAIRLMAAIIILTTAAMGTPVQDRKIQSENEEEMFWRGQQVASAIHRYRILKGDSFPTDLNELVRGIELYGKKIHLLRPSALCDPTTPCVGKSNWRLVHPGDPLAKELLDAVVAHQERSEIKVSPQSLQELARFAQMASNRLSEQNSDTRISGEIRPGEDTKNVSGTVLDDKNPPIIGVVSRKRGKMIRSYFGINEYDHAFFFSHLPVIANDFENPYTQGLAGFGGVNSPAKDPRCPDGGVFVDGKCYGALRPGQNCRDPITKKSVPCSSLKK